MGEVGQLYSDQRATLTESTTMHRGGGAALTGRIRACWSIVSSIRSSTAYAPVTSGLEADVQRWETRCSQRTSIQPSESI